MEIPAGDNLQIGLRAHPKSVSNSAGPESRSATTFSARAEMNRYLDGRSADFLWRK